MDEEYLYQFFIENDVRPDRARALAIELSKDDYSRWSKEQIVTYLDEFALQALEVKKPFSVYSLKEHLQNAYSKLGYPIPAVEPRGFTAKLEGQPPFIGETRSVEEFGLWKWFYENGVEENKASDLASRISSMDMSEMTDVQVDNLIRGELYYDQQKQAEKARIERDYGTARINAPLLQADREARAYGAMQRDPVSIDREYNRQLAQSAASRKLAWESQIPDMRSQAEVAAPYLEGLRAGISPSAQAYFERNIGGIAAGAGMAGARQAWWERKTTQPTKEPRGIGGEDWQNLSAEEQLAGESMLSNWQENLANQLSAQDPYETFLKNYDFERKFKSLTPEEQGFYSGKSRPRTRFL